MVKKSASNENIRIHEHMLYTYDTSIHLAIHVVCIDKMTCELMF